MAVYIFRCKTNPSAPVLKLEAWEAREMKGHPDYERIDEFGEIIVDEDEATEQLSIPIK